MSERARQLMRAQKLTEGDIAERIGVSRGSISSALLGRSKGAAIRFAIATVLNARVSDLWPDAKRETLPPEARALISALRRPSRRGKHRRRPRKVS